MRGLLVFRGILIVFALGLSAGLLAAVPEGSIDDFIDIEMPVSRVPGLAFAVVADGQVRTVGARGVVNNAGDQEVTPDTPFLIGSVSKSFTALAVMQLVEAGKIDLDAEISRYLDVFSKRPAGSVTIRQLLSHTSGFSTLQGNTSRKDSSGQRDELARQVARVALEAPAHAPDAKSGAFGLFSLWFPLVTTLGMAWTFFGLVPKLFGVPIGTLRLFQPDFGLVMIASAVTGVLWAVFRLGVAYSGRRE